MGIDNNDSTTTLELLIPFEDLEIDGFDASKKYNIEFAINKSSSDGLKREYQYRWNSSDMEGFNRNPSLWGDLILLITSYEDIFFKFYILWFFIIDFYFM